MYENRHVSNMVVSTSANHEHKKYHSRYDWQHFLFSLCDFFDIKLNWFELGLHPKKDALEVMVSFYVDIKGFLLMNGDYTYVVYDIVFYSDKLKKWKMSG